MSHIFQPPPKCSECGSHSSETFQRGPYVSGRRCLNCGHEHVVDHTPSSDGVVSWASGSTGEQTF